LNAKKQNKKQTGYITRHRKLNNYRDNEDNLDWTMNKTMNRDKNTPIQQGSTQPPCTTQDGCGKERCATDNKQKREKGREQWTQGRNILTTSEKMRGLDRRNPTRTKIVAATAIAALVKRSGKGFEMGM